jgi:hypothetical protein
VNQGFTQLITLLNEKLKWGSLTREQKGKRN